MPFPRPIRRRSLISARICALSALLLITSLWLVSIARRYDLRACYLRNAPDCVVIFHAEGSTSSLAIKALAEWIHRYEANRLTDADRNRLFDHLLTWQADLSRAWDPAMGDILLTAASSNHLSRDREDRFTLNSFAVRNLRVRPAIRPGDPVAIEYTAIERGCTSKGLEVNRMINGSFRRPPPRPDRATAAWLGISGNVHRGEIAARDAGTDNLTPGPARLHLLLNHSLRWHGSDLNQGYAHNVQTRQDLDVTILPRDAPLGTPAPDPTLADAVARSVRLVVYRVRSGQLYAELHLEPAPANRAFNVCVNPDHPQVATQRFAAANDSDILIGGSSSPVLLPIDVPSEQASIQLQLVGADDALRHSARLKTYWSGTITYTVPIENGGGGDGSMRLHPFATAPGQ
jgi:hypothetical protein